jgi:hypothetical protein
MKITLKGLVHERVVVKKTARFTRPAFRGGCFIK